MIKLLLSPVALSLRLTRKLLMTRPGALAAGALGMYFLDPEQGPSRRANTVSQVQGMVGRRSNGAQPASGMTNSPNASAVVNLS